jgi:hypothetical protein
MSIYIMSIYIMSIYIMSICSRRTEIMRLKANQI